MTTLPDIEILRDKYLEIIKLETEEMGVKPTEVRHLIGRLGEFHCALSVKGELAHTANQHGFDVVSESGRRISVKTSAQADRGFFIISNKTIDKVDDLMLLQYKDGRIIELYHGCIRKAVSQARYYKDKDRYNLDLSVAAKIA